MSHALRVTNSRTAPTSSLPLQQVPFWKGGAPKGVKGASPQGIGVATLPTTPADGLDFRDSGS